METNLNKRNQQVKYEPYVHHFDIRSFRQIVRHVDKHGRQDEHAGKVHCDDGFKEKSFEVVCTVSNEIQENSWEINCQRNSK